MLEQIVKDAARVGDAVEVRDGRVTVKDEAALTGPMMDALVHEAVFGTGIARAQARWMI